MLSNNHGGGKAFLTRILLATLQGKTPEQFADEELQRMQDERKYENLYGKLFIDKQKGVTYRRSQW
jgi:hypothetical protein